MGISRLDPDRPSTQEAERVLPSMRTLVSFEHRNAVLPEM
jgi:hypothetical protein